MTSEDVLSGASKYLEYKRERPSDAKKYLKTVVAFANGRGGQIVFGIEDNTREVIGIPEDVVFQEIDAITNAISDSIEPRIVPDVYVKTAQDRTIIVVEISPGMQRPYFIRKEGIMEGTYVRVSSTTRKVESYTLRELILDGTGKSYDSLTIDSQSVSEEEIQKLCADMTSYAKSKCKNETERNNLLPLTKNQLCSWEILVKKDGKLVPTYAFNLLAGLPIPSVLSSIQCAVFKGKTRSVFVDRKTYDGPIYRQIDDAYDFVLRMIRMGAKIEGITREDIYEFPPATVREMIANAVCHRSYLRPSHIQVALYDDRLEVTSPGMLSGDMDIERMKEGFSLIRNMGIAKAFVYMKVIEAWGTGIPRMMTECREHGLREPEMSEIQGDFRINLYRNNPIGVSKEPDTGVKEPDTFHVHEQMILAYFEGREEASSEDIALSLGLKPRRTRFFLQRMTMEGVLERTGNARSTRYKVKGFSK